MSFSGSTKPLRAVGQRGAFSLIEIVIALSVLGTMAAGCYIGFNAINTYAVSSRLVSEAQTSAQNQIDLVLSKEPFDITAAYVSTTFNPCLNKIPAELMTVSELDALASSGTCGVTFPTSAPTASPSAANYSSFPNYYPAYYPYYRTGSNQPLQKQAFIYHDPVTGQDVVKGVLTTTVTDTGMTMVPFADTTPGATPYPLNTRKARVAVTYDFRKITAADGTTNHGAYTVSIDTLRTADQ